MLHAVRFDGGAAAYRNRFVATEHLAREEEVGRALWTGLMEPFTGNPRGAPYKDSANTDVIYQGGRLYALWYICGRPYQIDLESLATIGPVDFGAGAPMRISAHAKVDVHTDELMFFDYGPRPPYLRYGVVDPAGRLERHIEIDVPGARLPHDMAITENHSILMDLPVFFGAKAAAEARWAVELHRELPARFAVIPRHGTAADVRWFEAEPCYIYHSVNAWEEGRSIVMVACRVEDPLPAADPRDGEWARMMANLRIQARLHRWRFDLDTGATHEEPLGDRNAEFPTVDARALGRPGRFGYQQLIADAPTLRFEGLVRHDLASGACQVMPYGPGRVGSEAPFAPRRGSTGEDDGYLVSFVHDEREGRSEVVVVDAADLAAGPVCRLALPGRVPLGFHACWVPG
jgi:carotenoid cleavage dioxygenase-like enzyme